MNYFKNKIITIVGVLAMAAFVLSPLQSHALGLGLDLKSNSHANVGVGNSVHVDTNSDTDTDTDIDVDSDENVDVESSSNSEVDLEYKNNEDLPRGIRVAPGIEKRVEAGAGLPWGIFKLFFGGDDDTDEDSNDGDDNDEVEIRISDVNIDVDTNEATISFETNVETKGTLKYSTESDLAGAVEVEFALDTEHSVTLDELDDDTTYYVAVDLETEDGEVTRQSGVRSFTTVEADTNAPGIMFYHVFDVENDSVNVIWITTEKTDAKVWVSTESDVDTEVEATVEETDPAFFHVLEVTELEADTEYHIQVSSTDVAGNVTFSETLSFTTDSE